MKKSKFFILLLVIGFSILYANATINPMVNGTANLTKETTKKTVEVRVAAYNVLFGIWGTPKRIAEMFKPYNLDIITFSEAPDGDWTAKVGEELGMKYAYAGKISSANHKDKYKSILSRTPITNMHEIEINPKGWGPASLVGAETIINGQKLLIYSLHIPGRKEAAGSASEFIANEVIPKITYENYIIMGDYNNHVGDAPLNLIEARGLKNTFSSLAINLEEESTHQSPTTGNLSGVIDHIYYNESKNTRVLDGGIIYDSKNPRDEEIPVDRDQLAWKLLGKPLSDHQPVWAVLSYKLSKQKK